MDKEEKKQPVQVSSFSLYELMCDSETDVTFIFYENRKQLFVCFLHFLGLNLLICWSSEHK